MPYDAGRAQEGSEVRSNENAETGKARSQITCWYAPGDVEANQLLPRADGAVSVDPDQQHLPPPALHWSNESTSARDRLLSGEEQEDEGVGGTRRGRDGRRSRRRGGMAPRSNLSRTRCGRCDGEPGEGGSPVSRALATTGHGRRRGRRPGARGVRRSCLQPCEADGVWAC